MAVHRSLQTEVIPWDFCHPMLVRAPAKFAGHNIRTIEADALQLPFPDACFNAVTIAFGLRNLEDPFRGLREIRRVLKPRGAAVILEFSKPVVPVFSHVFNFYFRHILPLLRPLISAYRTPYPY